MSGADNTRRSALADQTDGNYFVRIYVEHRQRADDTAFHPIIFVEQHRCDLTHGINVIWIQFRDANAMAAPNILVVTCENLAYRDCRSDISTTVTPSGISNS